MHRSPIYVSLTWFNDRSQTCEFYRTLTISNILYWFRLLNSIKLMNRSLIRRRSWRESSLTFTMSLRIIWWTKFSQWQKMGSYSIWSRPNAPRGITKCRTTKRLCRSNLPPLEPSRSQSDTDLSCDTSGELQLRMALTRRSLAFDQCGLASFDIQEKWHSHLITTLLRSPPTNHKFVTVQQILTADRELWLLMSQESRGSLKVSMGQDPPLDAMFLRYMYSSEVACFMTPLPAAKASPAADKPAPKVTQPKGNGKNSNKRKFEAPAGKGETIKQMLIKCEPCWDFETRKWRSHCHSALNVESMMGCPSTVTTRSTNTGHSISTVTEETSTWDVQRCHPVQPS